MNWYRERNWRSLSVALAIGLAVFGLSLQVAPASDSAGLLPTGEDATAADVVVSVGGDTHERQPTVATATVPEQASADLDVDAPRSIERRIIRARVIASSPVAGSAAPARLADRDVTVTCDPTNAPDFACCDEGEILTVINGCPGTQITVSYNGGADQVILEGEEQDFDCTAGVDSYTVVSVPRGGDTGDELACAAGDPCDCDQDCDGMAGQDQCNLAQCIVRGVCTGDDQTPCTAAGAGGNADADCDDVGGVCDQNSFRQRCDLVQLTGWSCDATPDNGFCEEDRCEDDGEGDEHSVCLPQTEGASGLPLSPCAKQCVGGAANSLNCDRSSECPQGSCVIKPGGACDETNDVCYVGTPGNASTAIGRCCTAGACTETTQAACGGGIWILYSDPDEQEGDGNCLCPKYGSGVAPNGADLGSIGPVRPSGLVCEAGTEASIGSGGPSIYCEDMDGDGFSPQFCLRRCAGGDLAGHLCEADNPDCANLGGCSGARRCFGGSNDGASCDTVADCGDLGCPGGDCCVASCAAPGVCTDDVCDGGDDDGLPCCVLGTCVTGPNDGLQCPTICAGATCTNDGTGCFTKADCLDPFPCIGISLCIVGELGFPCPGGALCVGGLDDGEVCTDDNDCEGIGICTAVEICSGTDPGSCGDDPCVSNAIEGGCEDGFVQIGDDYALSNGSYLRLTQFRFRGGITNQGEDLIFEIWDSTGTKLVDTMQVEQQIGPPQAATVNLPLTGVRDWTLEIDCWPSCDPDFEVPQPEPVIIPPNGYIVMRSARTVGTLNGAAGFWSQTDHPPDEGLNDPNKSWVNGNPNASLGTNVYMFELVGVKVPDPFGACCDESTNCENTVRWDCGLCSPEATELCASTLHDCVDGGLTGAVCQFNRWFGPTSHTDFEFGGADLTLCVAGIEPCNLGACCQGSDCTVTEEDDCPDAPTNWLGSATDCTPNCCPQTPGGVDGICSTSTCVADDLTCQGGADQGEPCVDDDDCDTDPADTGTCEQFNTSLVCTTSADCEPLFSCVLQYTEQAGIFDLRHPYECFDDFPSPLIPARECDPANGNADCTTIPCTSDGDCTKFEICSGGFCTNTAVYTCGQSFDLSITTSRNDSIDSSFGVLQGDGCSLNTNTDTVGWFERFNLVDPTPLDGADDCFVVTVSMCCTEPVLTPIWAFLSQFINCPCVEMADVFGIAPDFDVEGNLLAGFGPSSLANVACEDENWAGTFTVPPGEYAYQIRAGTVCQGTSPTVPCVSDADCFGTACVVGTADYTVHFTVESCILGACCVNETCSVTNKLDCLAQNGNFLGEGDQPVNTCDVGRVDICGLGSCCLEGQCRDDFTHDTKDECEGFGGEYFGGVGCDQGPCPACPFHFEENCQIVQTIFGLVPTIDRNPANGGDGATGTVLADDMKFTGPDIDTICWNAGFFATPCCQDGCVQNIDDTWEIRVYGPNADDPVCTGIPGPLLGIRTIQVLNKIEGTGQGTSTWLYSGSLRDTETGEPSPIALPVPGLAGNTYWVEVSGVGEPECEVHATWSRDQGNEHYAFATFPVDNDTDRVWSATQIGSVDIGFCEDSGIFQAPDVLGACCTCPSTCEENKTQRECVVESRGVWIACGTCDPNICPGVPDHDDCENPQLVTGVPVNPEGTEQEDNPDELVFDENNICATDDGPGLEGGAAGCGGSLAGGADMHDDTWFSYTAEACGLLTIHSCNDTDAMDQMIAVYELPEAGCPVIGENEINCGDDTCGVGAGPSTVSVQLELGKEYLIRVGGWNDEIPGGFIGSPRGFFTLHWWIENNCPDVLPPLLAPGPGYDGYVKNRYISIDVRGEGALNPSILDVKLTMTSTLAEAVCVGDKQLTCAIDADCGGDGPCLNPAALVGTVWWANAPDANCISLVGPDQPATPPNWAACDVVHVGGCGVIPTSTYDIIVIDEQGTPSVGALSASTQFVPVDNKWFGDTVSFFDGQIWGPPQGTTNFDDVTAALKTFQDPGALNATDTVVSDVHPLRPDLGGTSVHPNKLVNFNDVKTLIGAFQGDRYPGVILSSCTNP